MMSVHSLQAVSVLDPSVCYLTVLAIGFNLVRYKEREFTLISMCSCLEN